MPLLPRFPPPGPVAAFCDCLVAHDLPDLPAERRATVVAFAGRRIAALPTPMRIGVGVVSLAVDGVSRLIGRRRLTSFLARHPLPVLGEYVRLVRSLVVRPSVGHRGRRHRQPTGGPHRWAGVTAALETEVLVVGSGAGGAPTAAMLAEAGFDVLVLEEGPLVRQGDVIPFSLEQMDRQYRAGGVTVALGLPIDRLHRGVLRRWRHRGQQRAVPPPTGDRARPLAHAAPRRRPSNRRAVRDLRRGRTGALRADRFPAPRRRPARRCGAGRRRSAGSTTRSPAGWTTPPDPTPGHGRRRSMTETYLPRAEERRGPAPHRSPGESSRRRRRPGDPGARSRPPTAGPSTVDFAHVVVCGGAIQTPALLQRSGLRHRIGRYARRPPDGEARRPVRRSESTSPTTCPSTRSRSSLLTSRSAVRRPAPASSRSPSATPGSRFRDAVTDWRNLAVYYAAITSQGHGRVRPSRGCATRW